MSERACRWLALFNNIPYEKMPESWKYASNAYMLDYIERRAEREDRSPDQRSG